MPRLATHFGILTIGFIGLAGGACVGHIGGDETNSMAVSHVPARRLTRTEYNNTVRDLFGFDVGQPANDFPEDAAGANGLTVTDIYLEKSLAAATRLSSLVVDAGFIKCDPTQMEPRTCARETLEPFLKRAWRRPVSSEEVDRALAFLDVAASAGDPDPFKAGIALAIQSALMSPNFMFRIEHLTDPNAPVAEQLGPYEMASRLSYFLYESMPDDALFAAADAGSLGTPDELEAQVLRMLADPRGEAFVKKLTGKWLALDNLKLLNLDTKVYPAFDEGLRNTVFGETALFVKSFIDEDQNLRDMFYTDFTYLNEDLAKNYGLSTDGLGTEHTRVSLPSSSVRGGLLTQAAVLAASSVPANDSTAAVRETSVIFRGHFVMSHLLCAELPRPPEGVDVNAVQDEAEKNIPRDAPRKVREAVRLTTSSCSGCHSFIDPIGYSMEHFDILGRWRDKDLAGGPVDSTGTLIGFTGEDVGMFDGARSLGALIKDDPRVTSCLTKAMLEDALGRTLTEHDMTRAEDLGRRSDESGSRLRELIVSLVLDKAFTHQQGEAQ